MTLTKEKLTVVLSEKVGFNKCEGDDFIDAFFDEIRTTLVRVEGVKLSSFGKFELRDKKQRVGRNPKTGEEKSISARRVVVFHPSAMLKNLVLNNYKG